MKEKHLLRIRAKIERLVTDREAMVAENQLRASKGESVAYDDRDFYRVSEKLNEIIEVRKFLASLFTSKSRTVWGSRGSEKWIEFPESLRTEYWSADKLFGLSFSTDVARALLRECDKSGNLETGGILVGKYNKKHDHAFISMVIGPPPDSKRGPTTFERGIEGVTAYLDKLFRDFGEYYIGEWHFHPNALPDPSPTDRQQLQDISQAANYKCPEPVMLILGGNPRSSLRARVFLFSKSTGHVELQALTLKKSF